LRQHLNPDVGPDSLPLEPLGQGQPDGHRRIEMPAGHVTEGVRAAQHGQTGGQRDPDEPDTQLNLILGQEQARQHGGATNAEDQSERAQELRTQACAERGLSHG
jgi:hypothetical protein